MISAHDVASGLAGLLQHPVSPQEPAIVFNRVTVDSRQVEPGDLFVALPGSRVDGEQFIGDAVQRGAAGIIARRWPEGLAGNAAFFPVSDPLAALQALGRTHRERSGVRTIGVTGSVGKTSTKEATAGLLSTRFPVLKSSGNMNTEIGIPLVLLELGPEHRYAVLEMAMYGPGEIALLCRLARPVVGIVTNVGPVHLARLGSIEAITDAKAELVESLPPDGLAVLNADDERVSAMAARTRARVVTYGLSPAAGCRATGLTLRGLEGISFDIHWQGEVRRVETPLIGRHSVYAALAAATTGLSEGMSLDDVANGLAVLEAESRVQVRRSLRGATVLDDTYNASPASVKAALDLLAEMPGPRVAVLADMLELGSHEEEGHREVGQHAAGRADALLAIGPLARVTAAAARTAGVPEVLHFDEQTEALECLDRLAAPGAFVLLKGSRGMALEHLVRRLCDV